MKFSSLFTVVAVLTTSVLASPVNNPAPNLQKRDACPIKKDQYFDAIPWRRDIGTACATGQDGVIFCSCDLTATVWCMGGLWYQKDPCNSCTSGIDGGARCYDP